MERRKINFESLTEKIETVSPTGRLVFHVFAALTEFERNLIGRGPWPVLPQLASAAAKAAVP